MKTYKKCRCIGMLMVICFLFACKEHQFLHGQNNAVWSESIYLRGYHPTTSEDLTDEHINRYCEKMIKYNIRNLYLFAGPYGTDGRLPEYAFSQNAKSVIKKIRERMPGDVRILPWIGGIQNKTVFLDDSVWVQNALEDTERFVDLMQVDGVHLDFEYILKKDSLLYAQLQPEQEGDEEAYGRNVNEFHRKIRALLPQSFISSVVVATSRDTRPWKRKTSMEELGILTKYINQVSFLYYDTNIHTPELFQTNCDQLIQDIKTLKQGAPEVEYLVAIGTFVNEPRLQHYRNLKIETIDGTIAAINSSLKRIAGPIMLVDGLSIFCDWETNEQEWEQIAKSWFANAY